MRNQKGFTLIETLIVLVISVIVAGGLLYMLSGGRRTSRIAELDAQSQQNARVSVDVMVRDMRSIGYGIDYGRGQMGLVYAGPHDVVFNANIRPEPDDANTPGTPTAVEVSSSPSLLFALVRFVCGVSIYRQQAEKSPVHPLQDGLRGN